MKWVCQNTMTWLISFYIFCFFFFFSLNSRISFIFMSWWRKYYKHVSLQVNTSNVEKLDDHGDDSVELSIGVVLMERPMLGKWLIKWCLKCKLHILSLTKIHFSHFSFVQLSTLKFKSIQLRLFVKFHWKFVVKCAINQWKKY